MIKAGLFMERALPIIGAGTAMIVGLSNGLSFGWSLLIAGVAVAILPQQIRK